MEFNIRRKACEAWNISVKTSSLLLVYVDVNSVSNYQGRKQIEGVCEQDAKKFVQTDVFESKEKLLKI
jgi:hypothetical protein